MSAAPPSSSLFHKAMTPSQGTATIRTNRRRLIITKAVLAQVNSAASLHVQVAGGAFAPMEFLDSDKKRTADLKIVVEPGESVSLKVQPESSFGPTIMTNGTAVGGKVELHLWGHLEEVPGELRDGAKRRRVDEAGACSEASRACAG
mmetsp:Transcript_72682/g.162727  ORF Transcript_72682/g.162727 Transcript_72682/m.162727 type:complete len:147 (-) Transcript_72682:72-512(-)